MTWQYVGQCVFSLPISLVMIERIFLLCLIIIIKSEVWTITHCLGLGHETMVCAVFLSVFFWKLAHYLSDVTGSSTVKSVTCGCFVDTTRLQCAFAQIFMAQSHFQYCCLSIEKIHIIIEMYSIDYIDSKSTKLLNITFQSVPCTHAQWAILGDDVPWTCRAASHRFLLLLKYRDSNYFSSRLILRPSVEINCNECFYSTYFLEHVECSSHRAITTRKMAYCCWWPMLWKIGLSWWLNRL